MPLQRRKFLQLAAGGGSLLTRPCVARAQAYPSQPVRIIAGFPPGGPSDLLARLMGQYLSERLGQPFIVENRPGAASNLATETVARSPADGHTLLVAVTTNAINATLYDNLKFDFLRDIAPISGLIRFATLMEVNPVFPARTLAECTAAGRNPKLRGTWPGRQAGVGIRICARRPLHLDGKQLALGISRRCDSESGHIVAVIEGSFALCRLHGAVAGGFHFFCALGFQPPAIGRSRTCKFLQLTLHRIPGRRGSG